MNHSPPIVSELVLIGGGHAHVHVLKMLGMMPYRETLRQRGIRVTLIAKDIHTPYSGMLPGYVAGHYSSDQIHLDLQKICRFSNIRLIHASCTRIVSSSISDGGGGFVYCDGDDDDDDNRPPLRFDVLSIDVGSAPGAADKTILDHPKIIPVKPIANFCKFYQRLQEHFLKDHKEEEENPNANDIAQKVHRVCVVGGGAGGVELILSVQHNLQQLLRKHRHPHASQKLKMVLLTAGSTLLAEHNSGVQHIMTRILKERGIKIHLQSTAVGVVGKEDGQSHLQVVQKNDDASSSTTTTTTIPFDDCFWCTTASAPTWLSQKTPFACNNEGFLKVDTTMQVQDHAGVFAVGDCAHMVDHPRPKAGVFAVRAGPPLLENIMAYLVLGNQHLKPYIPQSSFLGIISTGDAYAVASKGSYFYLEGSLVWKWKDWIDRSWMAKYSTDLPDLQDISEKKTVRYPAL